MTAKRSEFSENVQRALSNERLRRDLRAAMDDLMRKRLDFFRQEEVFLDASGRGAAIRAGALAKLPQLLTRLEAQLQNNGIQVHWAETAEQANDIVLGIVRSVGADSVVKGKSMVTEEIGLNDYLEERNVEVIETDLGEYILQLLGERPSHIVMPAIHKSKAQIADLFAHRFPDIPYSEDVDTLTATARRILRDKFRKATVGISGVNFAIAETGSLFLVENEGNGRMCTTLPDVHIAVTGIEKVLESWRDLPALLALLTRSATGQPITTYCNIISSPRRDNEKDGPREVHLVLVDNGRSQIYSNPAFHDTLRCIRCGACINHCPVYTRIGGQAYGTVYPGPIGLVFEPQREGLDNDGELLSASSLCGACSEVCPVRIPLATLINRLRHEAVDPAGSVPGAGSQRQWREALAWKAWASLAARPNYYQKLLRLAMRWREQVPSVSAWSRGRTMPQLAEKSLHELMREREENREQSDE